MARIRDFTEVVKEQSRLFHPENPSTIVFATFIYAPQQCWFPANGPPPYDGYQNRLGMVRSLNDRIIDHNDETFELQREMYERLAGGQVADKSLAPKFHTYGLRKTTLNAHRWEHWRQSELRHMMLHLGTKCRKKMGTACVNYFKFQFTTK